MVRFPSRGLVLPVPTWPITTAPDARSAEDGNPTWCHNVARGLGQLLLATGWSSQAPLRGSMLRPPNDSQGRTTDTPGCSRQPFMKELSPCSHEGRENETSTHLPSFNFSKLGQCSGGHCDPMGPSPSQICPHFCLRASGRVCEDRDRGPDASPGPGQENPGCPVLCASLLKPLHPGEEAVPPASRQKAQCRRVQQWQCAGRDSPNGTALASPLPQDTVPEATAPSAQIHSAVFMLVSPCFPQSAGAAGRQVAEE